MTLLKFARTFTSFWLPKLSRKKIETFGACVKNKVWTSAMTSVPGQLGSMWRGSLKEFVCWPLPSEGKQRVHHGMTDTWRVDGARQMAEPCAYSGWHPMAWMNSDVWCGSLTWTQSRRRIRLAVLIKTQSLGKLKFIKTLLITDSN